MSFFIYKYLGHTAWVKVSLEKPLHVGIELKKGQKQGIDYTTQKKTNLIQEAYPQSQIKSCAHVLMSICT